MKKYKIETFVYLNRKYEERHRVISSNGRCIAECKTRKMALRVKIVLELMNQQEES